MIKIKLVAEKNCIANAEKLAPRYKRGAEGIFITIMLSGTASENIFTTAMPSGATAEEILIAARPSGIVS